MFWAITLSLIPKILLTVCVYQFVRRYYSDMLFVGIFSYLLSYLGMIIIMLILSVFQALTRIGLVAGYLATAILLIIINRMGLYKGISLDVGQRPKHHWSVLQWTAFVAAFGIFIALAVRSQFYYDTTDDALVQGLPKIGFIFQHKSLFVNYRSLTVNTFSNEWLGELNSVYYMVLTGRDLTTSFANVEVWLFVYFIFMWLPKGLGGKRTAYPIFGLFASASAVTIGLAMTIKTDLIAIAMLPFAAACIMRYLDNQTSPNLLAAITALGCAAGAKITLVPCAGLGLIALIIFFFVQKKHKSLSAVLFGALLFCTACSRYIINLFQYRNPFQRSLNEKIAIMPNELVNNLIGILGGFNNIPFILRTRNPYSDSNWVLCKQLGWSGPLFALMFVAAVIILLVAILRKKTYISIFNTIKIRHLLCIWFPVSMGFLFTLFSTIWYPWSYRYFTAYIMTYAVIAFVVIDNFLFEVITKPGMKKFILGFTGLIMIVFSILNGIYCFRFGQAIPVPLSQTKNQSQIERKLSYASVTRASDYQAIPSLMHYLENGGNALVMCEFSAHEYQFFGNDACVKVDLAYDMEDISRLVKEKPYDFVAITSFTYDTTKYEFIINQLQSMGYTIYTTPTSGIFVRE